MSAILVVDDDADSLEILSDILRTEGYDVRSAENGLAGLQRLKEKPAELVLLDVEMPVLDGPSMAYQMFLHDLGLDRIPVVLTSGVEDLKNVAGRVGTPYFLAKPYAVDSLLRLVGRALQERCPAVPSLASPR